MNESRWPEWRILNLSSGLVNVSERPSCPLGFGRYSAVDVCILETVVIVLLTCLIIAGNLTVVFVFHCAPLLHHCTTSCFIQTMAYADLFVGVSCLVPTLSLLHYSTGVHESLTCRVFGYIISVLKSVSMACLACISVDRYLAITKPLSYNQLVTPCRLKPGPTPPPALPAPRRPARPAPSEGTQHEAPFHPTLEPGPPAGPCHEDPGRGTQGPPSGTLAAGAGA